MFKKIISFVLIFVSLFTILFTSIKVNAQTNMEFSNEIKSQIKVFSVLMNDDTIEPGLNALENWLNNEKFDDDVIFLDSINDIFDPSQSDEAINRVVKDYFYVLMTLIVNSSHFTAKTNISSALFRSQIIFDDLKYLLLLLDENDMVVTDDQVVFYILNYVPDFIEGYKKICLFENMDPFAETPYIFSPDYTKLRNDLKETSKQIKDGTYVEKTPRQKYIEMDQLITDAVFPDYTDKLFEEADIIQAQKEYSAAKNAFYKWINNSSFDEMTGLLDVITEYKNKEYASEDEMHIAAIELCVMTYLSLTIEYNAFTSMVDFLNEDPTVALPNIKYAIKFYSNSSVNSLIGSLIDSYSYIITGYYDSYFNEVYDFYTMLIGEYESFYDCEVLETVTKDYYKNVRNSLKIGVNVTLEKTDEIFAGEIVNDKFFNIEEINYYGDMKSTILWDQGDTTFSETSPVSGLVINSDGTLITTALTPEGTYSFKVSNGYEDDYCESEVISFTINSPALPPVHEHNLVLVNGKDASNETDGYKAYYVCQDSLDACGKYYEDEDGEIEIADINAWKAVGGAGHIEKLNVIDPAPSSPGNNKVLIIIFICLGVIIVCGGTFFVLKKFVFKKNN